MVGISASVDGWGGYPREQYALGKGMAINEVRKANWRKIQDMQDEDTCTPIFRMLKEEDVGEDVKKGSLRASIPSHRIGTPKLLINQTNPNANLPNMKSSLALLARRTAVVASRRGVASPAVATTFVRAAFSTQAVHDFESNMVSVE